MCQSDEERKTEGIYAGSISHDRQDCIFELFIALNPPETARAIKHYLSYYVIAKLSAFAK